MSDHKPHKQRSIEKIKNGQVLERLLKHVNGELDLSATQVTVGIALLKKYLPDTKAIEHSGSTVHEVKLNVQSAKHIASAVRKGITE